jgi:hypothetical protein
MIILLGDYADFLQTPVIIRVKFQNNQKAAIKFNKG